LSGAETVAVLLSESGGYYREYFDALARSLAQASPAGKKLRLLELSTSQQRPDEASLSNVTTLVAVGVQAMRSVAAWDGAPPVLNVLNVLVPRANYEKLLAEKDSKLRPAQFSAIFLDQPPTRQTHLIAQVLPGKRRISTLLGPDSASLLPALRSAFQRRGLELLVEEISSEAEIIPALSRLMASSDAFLALPDSVVFTRETVRSVLMAAYRYHQPLLGFSQAYVTSGALAATYSTPSQIARQTAELLSALPPGAKNLPAPLYPAYFSVAVNRSVARALSLDIPPDADLLETLTAHPEAKR
jgi:hypothetical protein